MVEPTRQGDPLRYAWETFIRPVKKTIAFYGPLLRNPKEFGRSHIRKPDTTSIVRAFSHFAAIFGLSLAVNSLGEELGQHIGKLPVIQGYIFLAVIILPASALVWLLTRPFALSFAQCLLIFLYPQVLVFALLALLGPIYSLAGNALLLGVTSIIGGLFMMWTWFSIQPRVLAGATGATDFRSYVTMIVAFLAPGVLFRFLDALNIW
jgi:hypothetical protein